MTKWREVTIDGIAAPQRYAVAGGPFGSALGRKDYVTDGVPVIRGAQLGDLGAFSHQDLVFVSEDKAERHRGNLAFRGDVIVTQRGTVGQVGQIPDDAPYPRYLLSQSQMKLTVDRSQADARFVYYALLSPEVQDALVGSTISAGVPHINLATFRSLALNVPSLATQQRIAGILGALDDLIENNRRRIELLEQMAQAIYREWFVRFRYPGHEDATFVDSPLGPIPEGWEIQRLGDLAAVDKGLSYQGAHLTGAGTPMANLKCFRPGRGFRRDGTKPYSGPCKPKHRVAPGDLVMANTDLTQSGAVIGSPAVIPRRGFESGGIISHHLFVIRCADSDRRSFLYWLFTDDAFRSYARSVASGTTVLGFRPVDLIEFRFAYPSAALLKWFALFAGEVAYLAEELENGIEELAAIRDLLLPKLVTGEIDVSHVDLDAIVA